MSTVQQTTDTTCIVCGAAGAQPALTQNSYHIFRCLVCNFLFVHPTPPSEELAHFYDQFYAVPFERYAHNTLRNEGRIVDLERWQPYRGRLLEVGASYGHSLAVARARGWQVVGVELSPTASSYARNHFRLEVFNGDLLDAPLNEGSFDAAIMWHVLEHTHNPATQIKRLHSLLRPGGILGLRVPNVESFGARLAGRSWPWFNPPGHLWYFSPKTLPRLLARLGFEVVEVATLRGDGNNLYQHALIAFGGRLNALRRRLAVAHIPSSKLAPIETLQLTPPLSPNPPVLQNTWLNLLDKAQPSTDTLARWTKTWVEPLEAAGLGDELLCYTRRPDY